ncbi:MAG TPA: response regulator [Bacteroidota bacterium]|nr:response regulator [Bacteroidota bacterium]
MTILLVDDELDYRLLIRTVLMSRGCDVILAENGLEALEKAKGASFDLVITDIYMPVMDGIKMSRALRALPEFEKVPILYLSGYDDQHTLEAVKDPRYEGFLRKGAPLDELVLWVDYLTTPLEKRPKTLPKGTQTRTNFRPREGTRTFTSSPIL